jgi:hypothetical protein
MKSYYVMPENPHPINDVEQKMIELNVMLYENFGSYEKIFEFLQEIHSEAENSKKKEDLLSVILHFRCLDQLSKRSPGLLEIQEERNAYKNGALPEL